MTENQQAKKKKQERSGRRQSSSSSSSDELASGQQGVSQRVSQPAKTAQKRGRTQFSSSPSSDELASGLQPSRKVQNPQPSKKVQKQTDNIPSEMSRLNIRDIPAYPASMPESSTRGSGVPRMRLLLGEGTASHSVAMTREHPEAGPGMTVTSYEKKDDERGLFEENSEGGQNDQELAKAGAIRKYGVDVNNLSEFSDGGYDDTHFLYPRPQGRAAGESAKKLVNAFFEGSSQKLKPGGKAHIALPSSASYEGGAVTRNRIYGATPMRDAQEHNLQLHKKRRDPQERYKAQGYKHEMTGTTNSRPGLEGREFILKKVMTKPSGNTGEYSDIETDSGTDSDFER